MSVILLILKIIGWILLTLPALFLLIVFSCISCAGSLQDGWKHRRKYPGSGENALAASYSVVWLFL